MGANTRKHLHILDVTEVIMLCIHPIHLDSPAVVFLVHCDFQVSLDLKLHDGNVELLHKLSHHLITKPIYFECRMLILHRLLDVYDCQFPGLVVLQWQERDVG